MKPVFGDVARMIGGLLEDEKKKKKKTSVSASKYAVIDTKKLMAALPARPALFPPCDNTRCAGCCPCWTAAKTEN